MIITSFLWDKRKGGWIPNVVTSNSVESNPDNSEDSNFHLSLRSSHMCRTASILPTCNLSPQSRSPLRKSFNSGDGSRREGLRSATVANRSNSSKHTSQRDTSRCISNTPTSESVIFSDTASSFANRCRMLYGHSSTCADRLRFDVYQQQNNTNTSRNSFAILDVATCSSNENETAATTVGGYFIRKKQQSSQSSATMKGTGIASCVRDYYSFPSFKYISSEQEKAEQIFKKQAEKREREKLKEVDLLNEEICHVEEVVKVHECEIEPHDVNIGQSGRKTHTEPISTPRERRGSRKNIWDDSRSGMQGGGGTKSTKALSNNISKSASSASSKHCGDMIFPPGRPPVDCGDKAAEHEYEHYLAATYLGSILGNITISDIFTVYREVVCDMESNPLSSTDTMKINNGILLPKKDFNIFEHNNVNQPKTSNSPKRQSPRTHLVSPMPTLIKGNKGISIITGCRDGKPSGRIPPETEGSNEVELLSNKTLCQHIDTVNVVDLLVTCVGPQIHRHLHKRNHARANHNKAPNDEEAKRLHNTSPCHTHVSPGGIPHDGAVVGTVLSSDSSRRILSDGLMGISLPPLPSMVMTMDQFYYFVITCIRYSARKKQQEELSLKEKRLGRIGASLHRAAYRSSDGRREVARSCTGTKAGHVSSSIEDNDRSTYAAYLHDHYIEVGHEGELDAQVQRLVESHASLASDELIHHQSPCARSHTDMEGLLFHPMQSLPHTSQMTSFQSSHQRRVKTPTFLPSTPIAARCASSGGWRSTSTTSPSLPWCASAMNEIYGPDKEDVEKSAILSEWAVNKENIEKIRETHDERNVNEEDPDIRSERRSTYDPNDVEISPVNLTDGETSRNGSDVQDCEAIRKKLDVGDLTDSTIKSVEEDEEDGILKRPLFDRKGSLSNSEGRGGDLSIDNSLLCDEKLHKEDNSEGCGLMSRYDQHSREKQSRARATIILGLSERREVEAIMGTLSKSTLNEKCFAYLSTKTLRLPQFESRFNGATEAKKYFSFTVPEITVSIYDIINSVSKYTRVRPTVQRRIEYFLQMFLPRNGWPTNGKVIKYTLEENKLNSSGLDLSTNRSNTSSRKMNIEAIDEHVEMLKATFSQYIDKLNQEMLTFQSKYGTKIRSASIATSSPQDTGRSSAFRLHPRSHQGSGIVNVLADGAATTSTTGMKRIIDGENQQGLIIQTLRPLMRVVDNNGDDSDLCHQEGETTSPSPNDASSFSSLSKSGSRTPQSSGQNASGSLPGTLKRNVSEDTLSLVSQCVPANIFSPGFIRAFTQKYILPHMIGRHHEIFACSARRWGRSNTPNHTCVSLPQLSTDKTSGMKNSTSKAHSHSSQTLSKAPSLHRPTIPSSNRAHITHSTSPRAIDAADEHTERIAAIIGTKTGFFMASDANSWVSLCDEILEPLSQLLLVRHCNHIQNNRGCQSDGGGVRSSGGKRRTPSTAYTSDSTVYHSYPCNTTQELHVRQKSELAAAYHRILTTVVPPHLQHLRQLYIDSMDPFELLMVTSVCGLCPSGSFQAALTTAVDSLKFHLQASLIAEGNSGLSFTGQYGNNNVRDLSSPIGTSSPTSVSTLASMLSTQSQTAISNSHQRNGPRLPSVKIIPVEAARSICFGVPILMHFFEHIATW